MRYAVFDLETTGLSSKDEAIQFGCVLTNSNFEAESLINFYCYTQQKISANALKVHNINRDMLMKLSNGLTFEDQMQRYPNLFNAKDIVWVEYSTNGFDMRVLNQTLRNNGLPEYNFGQKIHTLNKQEGVWNFNLCGALAAQFYRGVPRKLAQATSLLGYPPGTIDRIYNNYLTAKSNVSGACFHNADYDAFVTWLLLYRFRDRFRM